MSAACYFCEAPIQPGDVINRHHPVYKSRGGIETTPAHEQCHRAHHKEDFKEWGREGGKLSALDKHWAFTLKNVKTDPLYDQARSFNQAHYAH
jgi:hypothetical protein